MVTWGSRPDVQKPPSRSNIAKLFGKHSPFYLHSDNQCTVFTIFHRIDSPKHIPSTPWNNFFRYALQSYFVRTRSCVNAAEIPSRTSKWARRYSSWRILPQIGRCQRVKRIWAFQHSKNIWQSHDWVNYLETLQTCWSFWNKLKWYKTGCEGTVAWLIDIQDLPLWKVLLPKD